MARPRKNNADYFPHDSNMRSTRKIIALRNKFWLVWYAVWNMLLEHIASCDFFDAKRDEIEKEIISGDFWVSVTEIEDIASFCHRLDLIQIHWESMRCEELERRLGDMVEKRNRERNRVSATVTTQYAAESTQKKRKETKVKEKKEIPEIKISVTVQKFFDELILESTAVKNRVDKKYLENQQLEFEKILNKWYTEDQLDQVLDFVINDDFWRGNCQSISKLRKKNREWSRYIDVFLDKSQTSNPSKNQARKLSVLKKSNEYDHWIWEQIYHLGWLWDPVSQQQAIDHHRPEWDPWLPTRLLAEYVAQNREHCDSTYPEDTDYVKIKSQAREIYRRHQLKPK